MSTEKKLSKEKLRDGDQTKKREEEKKKKGDIGILKSPGRSGINVPEKRGVFLVGKKGRGHRVRGKSEMGGRKR